MKKLSTATAMRRVLCLCLPLVLTACAGNRPLEFTKRVALQDPLPEHAAIYLVRAPHDGGTIELALDGRPVATLSSNGYTTIQVREGQRRLTSKATGSASDGQVDYLLEARPGERHFYYLVQPSDVKPQTNLVMVTRKLLLLTPGYGGTPVPSGARLWQEMSEPDAQGMLSISKLVMPVQVAY